MMTILTPPPPEGYFYAASPVDAWLLEARRLPPGSFDLNLYKRRRFWFNQFVASEPVKAHQTSGRVSLADLDDAAVRLNKRLEELQQRAEDEKFIETTIEETNKRG